MSFVCKNTWQKNRVHGKPKILRMAQQMYIVIQFGILCLVFANICPPQKLATLSELDCISLDIRDENSPRGRIHPWLLASQTLQLELLSRRCNRCTFSRGASSVSLSSSSSSFILACRPRQDEETNIFGVCSSHQCQRHHHHHHPKVSSLRWLASQPATCTAGNCTHHHKNC